MATEDGRQEDRRWKTGRQKMEDRRWKTGDGRQKMEEIKEGR